MGSHQPKPLDLRRLPLNLSPEMCGQSVRVIINFPTLN